MIYSKWVIGTGVAVLLIGLVLAPAALSGFTTQTSFSTQVPLQGQSEGDALVITEGIFSSPATDRSSDAGTPLGDNRLEGYRLNMDGRVYEVGGLGDSVVNYRGEYRIVRDDDALAVSSGTFELQAMGSVTGQSMMLNALLSEQAAAAGYEQLAADGGFALTSVSGDGQNFEGRFRPRFSNDQDGIALANNGLEDLDLLEAIRGLNGLDDGTCHDLLKELLCEHRDLPADATVVPEPATLGVLGLLGLAAMTRRGRPSHRRAGAA